MSYAPPADFRSLSKDEIAQLIADLYSLSVEFVLAQPTEIMTWKNSVALMRRVDADCHLWVGLTKRKQGYIGGIPKKQAQTLHAKYGKSIRVYPPLLGEPVPFNAG